MKRRTFFRFSLVAAMLQSATSTVGAALAQAVSSRGEKVLVKAGGDRDDKPFRFLEATFQVKVSGKDNENRCMIFDTQRPEKVGPPLHLHVDCDEWFYGPDGQFKFRAGEEILHLKTGDSLLVPRNMPHAIVKTSEGTARLIVMHQPAGTMEAYFRAASLLTDKTQAFRKAFAEEHGMRILGPALQPD